MRMRTVAPLAGLLCWCCAALIAGEAEVKALIQKVKPAYVFIGGGSGAVISPDGLLITNHHVVFDPQRRTVPSEFAVRLGDGRALQAKVLGYDVATDIALLRIAATEPLPFMPLGDSDALRTGDAALAVGNPVALGGVDQNPTFTLGVISGLHQFRGAYSDAIVTDVPLNPGNSGGPLVNLAGELVGVNGMIQTRWGLLSSTGIGFAVPSNQIADWLPLLQESGGGQTPRGRLYGLKLEPDPEKSGKGSLVTEVVSGGEAEALGLRAGDLIIGFGGREVWSRERFVGLLNVTPPGVEAEIAFLRGGKEEKLSTVIKAVKEGRLGFVFKKPEANDKRLVVDTVEAGCPAAAAGLLPGDELLAFNGKELNQPAAAQKQLFDRIIQPTLKTDMPLRLRVARTENGTRVEKELVFKACAGKTPDEPEANAPPAEAE